MTSFVRIPFSGDEDDWESYYQSFMTQADMIGFAEVIEGNETVPKDGETLDTEEKKRIRNMNKTAFYALTVSMTSQVNKDIVFESTTSDLKRGDSKLAWDNIKAKYTVDNSRKETELQNKFLNCILTPNEHPSDWIARMEKMKNKITKSNTMVINDKGFRERLIENLPSRKYHMLKLNLLTMNDDASFTTDDCKKQIINYYMILNQNAQNATEIALNVFQDDNENEYCTRCKGKKKKHLKKDCWKDVKCNFCGNMGHPDNACYKNPKSSLYRPNGQINNEKKCNYCHKNNHTEETCIKKCINEFKKKHNIRDSHESPNDSTEIEKEDDDIKMGSIFNVRTNDMNKNDNVWVIDSGASDHVIKSTNGFTKYENEKPIEKMRNADGNKIDIKCHGDFIGNIVNKDSTIESIELHDVRLAPSCTYNLISMIKMMKSGYNLSDDENRIILHNKKENKKLIFDIKIKSGEDSHLLGMMIIPSPIQDSKHEHVCLLTKENANPKIKIDINEFHKLIGHTFEKRMRETATHYGYVLTGKLEDCVDCSLAKASRKKLNKISTNQATSTLHYIQIISETLITDIVLVINKL